MPTTRYPLTTTSDVIVELAQMQLAILGCNTLDIRHTHLRHLDNDSDPCTHCQREGAVVAMQAYFRSDATGEDVLIDGCTRCILRAVAADANSDLPVTLETALPEEI